MQSNFVNRKKKVTQSICETSLLLKSCSSAISVIILFCREQNVPSFVLWEKLLVKNMISYQCHWYICPSQTGIILTLILSSLCTPKVTWSMSRLHSQTLHIHQCTVLLSFGHNTQPKRTLIYTVLIIWIQDHLTTSISMLLIVQCLAESGLQDDNHTQQHKFLLLMK